MDPQAVDAFGTDASPTHWHEREMLLLQQVMCLIGQSPSHETALREMLHLMSELLGLDRGRIVLRDDHENTCSIRYAHGLTMAEVERGRYALGEGVTGRVVATGQLQVMQDIDDQCSFVARAVERSELPEGPISFIALPIKSGQHTIGALACHRIRRPDRALADDLMLLRVLATLTGHLLHLHAGLRQKTWALEQENAMLERAIEADFARYGIVGASPTLLHAMSQLERVSDTSASVLLLGESGTGKELFARALHLASPRRDKPFIKLNCAAIPESLFEAELFGHERGTFTGATGMRAGWFEQADTGTLFLDEIGELPRSMQTKLLRALQEGTISRLGGKQEIHVDVRLVAATNRDLKLDVKNGLFRQDLYYRINVIPIRLPSLAERREDIPVLILHFLNQTNQAHQRNVNLSADAIRLLQQQPWQGNIRELENVIKRIVLLADKPIVDSDGIGRFLPTEETPTVSKGARHSDTPALAALVAASSTGAVRHYSGVQSHSPDELRQAVAQSGGNKSRAAQLLGLTTRQFAYRWEKYELDSTDEAPTAALPPSS